MVSDPDDTISYEACIHEVHLILTYSFCINEVEVSPFLYPEHEFISKDAHQEHVCINYRIRHIFRGAQISRNLLKFQFADFNFTNYTMCAMRVPY